MMRRNSTNQWWFFNLSAVLLVAATMPVAAAESPYVSLADRGIKALSSEQIEGYETGQGMTLALAAELNGYPGPKHVLEFREELNLTDAQALRTENTFQEMKTAAENLGRQIVLGERELDDLFTSQQIDARSLSEKVLHIAELQGRLRTVHLQAHLEMMEILDHQQIMHYIELRGYHGKEHAGHR